MAKSGGLEDGARMSSGRAWRPSWRRMHLLGRRRLRRACRRLAMRLSYCRLRCSSRSELLRLVQRLQLLKWLTHPRWYEWPSSVGGRRVAGRRAILLLLLLRTLRTRVMSWCGARHLCGITARCCSRGGCPVV